MFLNPSWKKIHAYNFLTNHSFENEACHMEPISIPYLIKTSYHKIIWSLKATRFCVQNCLIVLKFYRHLAALQRHLPNFKVIRWFKYQYCMWDFTKSSDSLIGYWNVKTKVIVTTHLNVRHYEIKNPAVPNLQWTAMTWLIHWLLAKYNQTSNISRTLVGNEIVDHWCSWSSACRRFSNYIFILYFTPSFSGLGKDNSKAMQESFNCWDLLCLILEVFHYLQ